MVNRTARPPRPSLRTLPLGLQHYRPGQFEALHQAGARIVTASGVPALLGQSRFASRYAYMAHLAGLARLEVADGPHIVRGKVLEQAAIAQLLPGERPQWQPHQVRALAHCPGLAGFCASPDGLVWDAERPDAGWGIIEAKTVGATVFQRDWLGAIPVDIQLQHQAQFACTGASWGAIILLIFGEWRFDLLVFDTAPRADVIAVLREQVAGDLAMLDRGEMPDPDATDSTVRALLRVYPHALSGKSVDLPEREEDEAIRRMQRMAQARLDRLAAEKVEDACRNWFLVRARDASRLRIGQQAEVRIASVRRSRKVIEAGTERRLTLHDHVEDTTSEDAPPSVDMLPPLF